MNGVALVRRDLLDLLGLSGIKPLSLERMVYPRDKKNVPSVTKFCLLFIEIVEKETNETKIRLQQAIPTSSCILGRTSSFLCVHRLNSAYILLGMFQGNSLVMLNQLYDVQSTLIYAVFCAAKASVYLPTEPLYLVQDGSDPLEKNELKG